MSGSGGSPWRAEPGWEGRTEGSRCGLTGVQGPQGHAEPCTWERASSQKREGAGAGGPAGPQPRQPVLGTQEAGAEMCPWLGRLDKLGSEGASWAGMSSALDYTEQGVACGPSRDTLGCEISDPSRSWPLDVTLPRAQIKVPVRICDVPGEGRGQAWGGRETEPESLQWGGRALPPTWNRHARVPRCSVTQGHPVQPPSSSAGTKR